MSNNEITHNEGLHYMEISNEIITCGRVLVLTYSRAMSLRMSVTGRPWVPMAVTDDSRLAATGLEAEEDVPRGHGPRLGARGISPQNE